MTFRIGTHYNNCLTASYHVARSSSENRQEFCVHTYNVCAQLRFVRKEPHFNESKIHQ